VSRWSVSPMISRCLRLVAENEAVIADCSRCAGSGVPGARVAGAFVCAACLTSREAGRLGEPLHARLLAEFQRRYRANPSDRLLDDLIAVIEKVDVCLADAKLHAHLRRWGASSYETAA
jgi:hypothetical protein